MASLTPDALWIQDTWRLRWLALENLALEGGPGRRELVVALVGPTESGEKLTLEFASAAEVERWRDKIRACQLKHNAEDEPIRRMIPEGVALVRKPPDVPRVELGRVSCSHKTAGLADRGAQLRAAMRGADAIVELQREKCPEMGPSARRVSGLAVRAEDADARKRLRWTWYAEEVGSLVKRILILLVVEASLVFFAGVYLPGKTGLSAATGESISDSLVSNGLGVGLLFGWPALLAVMLALVRWRELILPVGIATLVATTVRGLVVVLAHLLAIVTTGADLKRSKVRLLADPVDWAFMIAGVVLMVRAWRCSAASQQILPEEALVAPLPRRLCARGLLAATGIFALFWVGWAGISRYDESRHLLHAGVDPRREQEALLALNAGAELADNGNLAGAEESFQRSLRLWEALTADRRAPSIYRINLAVTLHDLGWIRLRQDRAAEAEAYYSRAVALADQVAGDPQLDESTKRTFTQARKTLADLHRDKTSDSLNKKSAQADRKCEEAEVRDQKGEAEAESLYREAIALWEEVLPDATNAAYRKSTVARLAAACLRVGEIQQQNNNRSASEASLKKAIEYGEKAVALDPARPLPRHYLGVARRTLERTRAQAFLAEIDKLARGRRFADVSALFARGIEEQDKRVRSGIDLELAVPSLAYRLERFAWFLAHCPDDKVRDTKAAVLHARKAAELRSDVPDYWYTLAVVHYRNGDWRDSLASLDNAKVTQGDFDACEWLVSALNLYRLNRQSEARAAVRKAGEWIDERTRKADDARLRIEYELMRPAIEGLMREARQLFGEDVSVG
jgi:tetratricopeptide (TPR) repeat protein